MSVRLVSWNILEGLLSKSAEPDVADDTVRRDAAVSLVSRLRPDILILNEALYAEPYDGEFRDYAEMFGFPYAIGALYDGAWGNAILSRHPIKCHLRTYIHPFGSSKNRGGVAAKIATPIGEVWCATFHPHPRRRSFKRGDDFESMLEQMDGAPVVFAGDFNAISPEDGHDHDHLVSVFERFSRPGEATNALHCYLNSGRILFEEVFPRFGMTDAMPLERRKGTMPTKMLSGDPDGEMRIDHVLASTGVEVVDGRIVREPEADAASDHYPILIDFSIRQEMAA